MKDPYVICRQCSKFKTMNCPNSFFCFATKDKPFFEKKESKKSFLTKLKTFDII